MTPAEEFAEKERLRLEREARGVELEGQLRVLAGEIASAQAEFLGLVAEFDNLEGWAPYGARSVSDWLSIHCGHAGGTARKEVALAHAVQELPVLADAMARGAMSLDKAAAVASLATPESEAGLVELALETTANQLTRLMGAARRAINPVVDNEDAAAQRRARVLHTWWDRDGMLAVRGRLTPEDGAVFRKALEKGVDLGRRFTAGGDIGDDLPEPGCEVPRVDLLGDADDRPGAARADALTLMAHTFLDSEPVGTGGDHYLVIIHVDEDALVDDGEGRCHIEGGPGLPVDVVRRLACGSSLVWLAEDADGNPVAVSPKTQDIPTGVRRAVRARDGGCVFPNGIGGHCGLAAEWSHVHHVQHRTKGGPHTTDNCHTHCSFHHHLLHEGGFSVNVGADGQLEYYRPDGSRIVNERPKLWEDGPPPRRKRDLDPDGPWARSRGERLNLDLAVDLVLAYTGDLYNQPETRFWADVDLEFPRSADGEWEPDDGWDPDDESDPDYQRDPDDGGASEVVVDGPDHRWDPVVFDHHPGGDPDYEIDDDDDDGGGGGGYPYPYAV